MISRRDEERLNHIVEPITALRSDLCPDYSREIRAKELCGP